MHPDLAEVIPEPWLEEGARGGIERPAGAEGLEKIGRSGWSSGVGGGVRALALQRLLLSSKAFGTRRCTTRAASAGRLSGRIGSRHAHHLIGDAVGFMLVRVVRSAYVQLRLDDAGVEEALQGLIAETAL